MTNINEYECDVLARIIIRDGLDMNVSPYIYKAQNNNELGPYNYIYYLSQYLIVLVSIGGE